MEAFNTMVPLVFEQADFTLVSFVDSLHERVVVEVHILVRPDQVRAVHQGSRMLFWLYVHHLSVRDLGLFVQVLQFQLPFLDHHLLRHHDFSDLHLQLRQPLQFYVYFFCHLFQHLEILCQHSLVQF